MTTTLPSVSTATDRYTGRVKWFNNKAGYGFITVTDGPKASSDIFVHHSSIQVDSDQYKYLVQGEYVEFILSSVSNDVHDCQAGDVSGIKCGKLMCETRHELKSIRTQYASSTTTQPPTQSTTQSTTQPTKYNGNWTDVKKARTLQSRTITAPTITAPTITQPVSKTVSSKTVSSKKPVSKKPVSTKA